MRRIVRAGVDATRLGVIRAQIAGSGFLLDHRDLAARAAPESSAITLNGCILILPYGQFLAHRPQPMHQSSMITSSELRRRMEPTGQPTMHSGSRHWRQEVATRYLSKRSPSRISRVTPSCASAQARTHASQRVHFSRSSISRLCASIKPCARKLSSGTLLPTESRCAILLRAVLVATASRLSPHVREIRPSCDGNPRRRCAPAPRDRAPCKWPCGVARAASRSRRNNPPRAKISQHQIAAGMRFGHLHEADADQIESCRRGRPGGRSRRPCRSAPAPRCSRRRVDELVGQRREHRHAAQMICPARAGDSFRPAAP